MVDYEYAELFENDSLDKQIHIAIQGTQSVLGNEDIMSESFRLIESLCSEEYLKFGAVEPRSVKFTVKYNAPKMLNKWLTITMSLQGAQTPFSFGDYQVLSDKPSSDRTTREVTAYGRFYKILRNTYKNWYKNVWGSSDSMTIKEFRDSFFARLHETHSWVVQETTTLPNDSAIIKKAKKIPRISGKDILNAICEINGVFGYIGRDGIFHYLRLDNNQVEYEIANTFTISTDYEDYTTTAIDRIQILSEDGDVLGTAGEDSSDAVNTYTIKNNFMLKGLGHNDYAKNIFDYIASNLLAVMNKVTYVPFEAEFKGNPCFEIGDKIVFNSHGQEIRSYILERTMSGIQSLRDSYSAQGEEVYPEDTNSLSSRISKVEDAVGIVDITKSTNYVGTSDPTGGGGIDPVSGQEGDVFLKTTTPRLISKAISIHQQSSNWTCPTLTRNKDGTYFIVFAGTNTSNDSTSYYNETSTVVLKVSDVGQQSEGTVSFFVQGDFSYTGIVDGPWMKDLGIGIANYPRYYAWANFGTVIPTGFYSDAEGNDGCGHIQIGTSGVNHFEGTLKIRPSSDGCLYIMLYRALSYTTATATRYGFGTMTIRNFSISRVDSPVYSDPQVENMYFNDGTKWNNIDYVNDVSQTQSSTGGTEIAEIQNTNGTKTKIYQKTVDPNPTGTPTETLSSIAIGDTLYELGGASAVSDLTDVTLDNLSNGQVLKYNNTSQKWENANESGGGSSAEMLAPTPFIYSETEEQVGIWIDGKPLYQKTLSGTTITGGQTTNVAHNIANIDKIINSEIIAHFSDNNYWRTLNFAYNNGYVQDSWFGGYAIDATNIHFQIGTSFSATLDKWYATVFYTKTTDTAWQGGFKAYGFSPVIYSDTEREIGVWTDGKPLYQKTVSCGALPNASTKQVAHGISNLDTVVNIFGYTNAGSGALPIPYATNTATADIGVNIPGDNTSVINLFTGSNRSNLTNTYITLQYTKTTDTAGSGKYTTLGTPTVHYDGEERVIGTWFGETLYQKTFRPTSPTAANTAQVIQDITSLNVKDAINLFGNISNVPINWSLDSSNGVSCFVTSAKTGIAMKVINSLLTNITCNITLQYTKTS